MTTSVFVSFKRRTMSAVEPGAFWMIFERYCPSPSCVMPRATGTPSRGTSLNLYVLFGHVKTASERSLPTLFRSMSIAALNSMSRMWYPPRFTCMRPGTKSESLAFR